MHIAITLSDNKGMDSTPSTVFARCPFYMLIDPETSQFSIEENPAQNTSGGAGIKAAQWMVDKAVGAVVSGNLGPKAHTVLSAAGIPVFKTQGESIEAAINAYNAGQLESLIEPNTEQHSGLRSS